MTLAWLRILTSPMAVAERLALNPEVPFGLSNIRSFVGVYVLCVAVFGFLTLKTGDKKWLLVLLCMFAGSAIGRTCGLVLDGFHQQAVGGIAAEIFLIAMTFGAYRKLPSK
jgi:hypothetical protein